MVEKVIFTYYYDKRRFKIIINDNNIRIFERKWNTNKYEKIDYEVNNYKNILYVYGIKNIQFTKKYNLYLENIYEVDYNKINSLLIQLDECNYIFIYNEIYIFKLYDKIKEFKIIHKVNKVLLMSLPFIITDNYSYNLDDKRYRNNLDMPNDINEYFNIRDDINLTSYLDDSSIDFMIDKYILKKYN
jgi:hypothetical protein